MNKSLYKIFPLVFLFSISFVNAHAQYNEYFQFVDVRATVVYVYAMEDVIDADAKILKANKVKEVIARDEQGNIINRMTVNAEGWIEKFSTNEYTDAGEINYKIEWDESNRITLINYNEGREKGMNISYAFNYNENFIDVIKADFHIGGLTENYIFHSKELNGLPVPDKIGYHDTYKDTVYMMCLFNYNSEGKIQSVYHDRFPDSPLDSVSYSGNYIFIDKAYYGKRKFELMDYRIIQEEVITPKQNLAANYNPIKEKDIVTTKNYIYKDTGLIDYIEHSVEGTKKKIIFEYNFYE